MKKRALSMLLMATMTATLFTGCGNSSSDSASTKDTKSDDSAVTTTEKADDGKEEASGKAVTLRTVSMFGGTDANAPTYQEINNQFMEDNKNVTIEDNSQKPEEDWKASISADFAVGNEPDVIQYYADATANSILATDKFVTLEEIQAEYPEYAKDTTEIALKAVTNPDGVSRAVPTTGFWEGLFCNKDLFDANNIELPTDWASFVTAIEAFKEADIIPIAVSLNEVPHYWIEHGVLYTAGAESYISTPETAPAEWSAGLDLVKTLRDMGAFPEDTDTVDDAYTTQLFADKKAAMKLDGAWFMGNVTDTENTVVVNFPGVENQKESAGTVISGMSSGFYITKKAWEDPDKKDLAVKLVMAHTGKEGVQKYWEATGAVNVAATEVTPIDDMTPLSLNALEFANSAVKVVSPIDSRIGQEPYAILTSNGVKVSTGASKSEDVINESLKLYHDTKAE